VRSRHEIAAQGTRHRRAQHLPAVDRRQLDIAGDGLPECAGDIGGLGQLAVADRLAGRRVRDRAVAHRQRAGRDCPSLGGQPDQQLSGGCGALAHGRHRRGRCAAARRGSVVGHQAGVAHHHPDLGHGDAQFLGRRLTQFGASALPHLDLAGQDRDRSVLGHVDPRGDTAPASAAAPASRLSQSLRSGHGNDQARSQQLDEFAAVGIEVVLDRLDRFFAVGFQRFIARVACHGETPSGLVRRRMACTIRS
jgi:hypothetical protein